MNLPYPAGVVLNMADDAEAYFYNWYNGIIEEVNAIEDDAEVESRKMKLNGNAARLSLVFQVLKWATDGGGMQCVDLESVQAAIRMIGYYEETYRRIQELIVANNIGESKEAWLSLLGNTFTAGDAIVVGKRVELSRRSVYYALKQLCCQPKPPTGEDRPRNVSQTLSEQTGCTLHYCTFWTAKRAGPGIKVQKCSVQTTKIRAAMSEYRFHLQKYRYGSKISCPNCGRSRCFVRYVDEESIIRFPDTVGKCDHENSCGYHYTPREYFRDNPDVLSQPDGGRADRRILPMAAERETPHPVPSFISADVVMRSLSHYEINPLYHYLCQTFGEEETQRLFRLYRIGTSSKWGGATIFLADGPTGTGADRENHAVRSRYRASDKGATGVCQLGSFGVASAGLPSPAMPFRRTPAEPHYYLGAGDVGREREDCRRHVPLHAGLHLAGNGGKNGSFNREAMSVLRDREVTLIPDLGATEMAGEIRPAG